MCASLEGLEGTCRLCNDAGVELVPVYNGALVEVAEEVLYFAARIAIADKKSRRRLYERLGREPDETVDWEAAEAYFKDIL